MAKTRCCKIGSGGDCGKLEGSFLFLTRRQALLNSRKLLPAAVWTEGAKSSDFSKEVRI